LKKKVKKADSFKYELVKLKSLFKYSWYHVLPSSFACSLLPYFCYTKIKKQGKSKGGIKIKVSLSRIKKIIK
jgi:hypothetical protein